ncbi:MAG: NAD-dependent epimerase/dehydratase family protein [Ruminococcaceae bacterium]|nr:NAD-dependent epimerase/dehydratase family protein [Oscillospiraceae bacterium]
MYNNMSVLLIGGSGTLGEYTMAELLRLGCAHIDVICLDDRTSDDPRVTYYQGDAMAYTYLENFLADRRYDGIVNFLHYSNPNIYPIVHRLLMKRCGHLIFLSSYRVYADEQHPITESAPKLLDVLTDTVFLQREGYAVPKTWCEHYMASTAENHWTVVRPVISFSKYRFDLVTHTGAALLDKMAAGETVPLPVEVKELVAGLDWAGNSGKLIANLLFKPAAFREAFTVSTAQNLTWEQVADAYAEVFGLSYKWVSTEEYLKATNRFNYEAFRYDRMYNRLMDNRKILAVTGLTAADFTPIKEALCIEKARYEAQ